MSLYVKTALTVRINWVDIDRTQLTCVVLRRNIVRQVVVQNQTQQTVEQREVDLLVHLRENRLHEHVALALARLPDIGQVVDALAPLVHEQRGRLGVLQYYCQTHANRSNFERDLRLA